MLQPRCFALAAILISGISAAALAETVVSDMAKPSWEFRGDVKAAAVDEEKAPGGKLLRVDVRSKGANPWDSAALGTPVQEIKEGQLVTVGFMARAVGKGNEGPVAVTVNLLQTAAPWKAAVVAKVALDEELGFFCLQGKAKFDVPNDGARVVLHVAGQKQKFDLGPYVVTVSENESEPTQLPCRKVVRSW